MQPVHVVKSSGGADRTLREGIVGVSAVIAAVKCVAVIRVERAVMTNAMRQIGVGDKVASKCDQIGVAILDCRACRRDIEAPRRDDRPTE